MSDSTDRRCETMPKGKEHIADKGTHGLGSINDIAIR